MENSPSQAGISKEALIAYIHKMRRRENRGEFDPGTVAPLLSGPGDKNERSGD